jgi:pimeloyl-ACP methyl ester carboxylesterase
MAHKAHINGIELSYAQQGEGQPVLFVHGSNVDERIWNDHSRLVGSRWRVIAPTQRYFGVSPWPDNGRGFSMRAHAADLAALIRALEIDPVTIVGWSYGAAVCLVMAAEHLRLVKRLFLYEPALATFVEDASVRQRANEDRLSMIEGAKAAASRGDNRAAVELFMDGVNDQAGSFRQLPEPVRAMMLENARMLPLLFAAPPPPEITCDDLHRLDVPVTVAVGAATRKFYRVAAECAARCLPQARLLTIDKARHLWPIQDTTAFSQVVLDFLADG